MKTYLRVKICDNGPGINNSKLKHIFHPYLNKSNSQSDYIVGSKGLGLSISKYICNQLNGDLKVSS